MPAIQLTFDQALNSSVQIGDIAYSVSTNGQDIFNVSNINNVVELGPIETIEIGPPSVITINFPSNSPPSNNGQSNFIMFSKDNAVNMSSVLGYYAEVKLVNKSRKKIELFSIGSQIDDSSK